MHSGIQEVLQCTRAQKKTKQNNMDATSRDGVETTLLYLLFRALIPEDTSAIAAHEDASLVSNWIHPDTISMSKR